MGDIQQAIEPIADAAQEPVEGGQANEAQKPEIPDWKKQKHKYKALGTEYEVDYDELVRRAEKGHGAEKRLAEAAKIEKEIKGRLEKLKNPESEDFDELIELIGFDKAKKFADKLVWDQIQWDELPDSEKRERISRHRAETAEQKLERLEDDRRQGEKQSMSMQAMQVIDSEIKAVLEEGRKEGLSVADIPEATEMIIDEMLAYLEYIEVEEAAGRQIRHSPPSHMDVLRKIQGREDNRSGAYLKHLSVDKLKSVLSKEQLTALRQAELDQLYAPTRSSSGRSTNTEANQSAPRTTKQERTKTEDFFKKMDDRYGG